MSYPVGLAKEEHLGIVNARIVTHRMSFLSPNQQWWKHQGKKEFFHEFSSKSAKTFPSYPVYREMHVDTHNTDWLTWSCNILHQKGKVVISHTAGNVLCSGSHVLRPTMPATGFCGIVNAEYRATAPPWEKPPITIRLRSMPFFSSSAIRDCTVTTATLAVISSMDSNAYTQTYLPRPYMYQYFIYFICKDISFTQSYDNSWAYSWAKSTSQYFDAVG